MSGDLRSKTLASGTLDPEGSISGAGSCAGILPLLRERFSPKAFGAASISHEEMASLIEAARWAPSAYNEQPWTFIVAWREEEEAFARLLSCLNEGNQIWAGSAAALMITVARRERLRDGEVNPYAFYDTGQAVAHLTVEAMRRGIYLHQMQGFNPARARQLLGIPSGHDPVSAIALGYLAEGDVMPGNRKRRAPDDLFRAGRWSQAVAVGK